MIKTFKLDDHGSISKIVFENGLSVSAGDLFYIGNNYMLITKVSSTRGGRITLHLVRKSYSGRGVYSKEVRLKDIDVIENSNIYLSTLSPEEIIRMKEEILETLIWAKNVYPA